ncbi:protein FAM104A isoform X1 [Lampris incognitus]|uniref:protein FAM104A isoform X1 n=1 Tax=Lampris incognitus TaxID=2546036 RepID=UPI0024B540C1|nr:protein FAM104A isoform X1 [Lampris incognitus]
MLTENRKRRRSCDSEEDQQLNPQAKRSGGGHELLVSDLDSEQSSSSDSNGGISSPDSTASSAKNTLSPQPEDAARASLQGFHGDSSCSSSVSYDHINRVLREAHFSSLQTRSRLQST